MVFHMPPTHLSNQYVRRPLFSSKDRGNKGRKACTRKEFIESEHVNITMSKWPYFMVTSPMPNQAICERTGGGIQVVSPQVPVRA